MSDWAKLAGCESTHQAICKCNFEMSSVRLTKRSWGQTHDDILGGGEYRVDDREWSLDLPPEFPAPLAAFIRRGLELQTLRLSQGVRGFARVEAGPVMFSEVAL